ncbi:hypothetical protein [Pseudomonas monteilii]|uniref:hypothetical protein n=1 Tax=Pseudomonas monteilii TaxID=76759 RepID=UPI001CBF6929|nr:hypothetical protein [Pseudomonas monteilii]MBZ3666002.1 hypothetical protein [Pseudomonas monteilii]MBZ3671346.1 hypothetical protein [Pseudomonas monteilii]
MIKNNSLLLAILECCISGQPNDWNLELTVGALEATFVRRGQTEWTRKLVTGHALLLVDADLVEVKDTSVGLAITRVTFAGYEFYERLAKDEALQDNQFLK